MTPCPASARFARYIFSSLAGALLWFAGSPASLAEASESGGLLLVANKGDSTLGIIDLDAGKQIAAVPQNDVTGHEVAASPDGSLAFVPIFGNSGVGAPGTDGRIMRVIDIDRRKIVATVDFGKGVRPHCATFGPNGLLYVTTELDQSVTVVDPKSYEILHRIPTGQDDSHMLAISSDGRRGYTSNVRPGTVSVLDLENRQLLKIVKVAEVAQRISISVDDRWVFTADQRQPRLVLLNTADLTATNAIPLPGIGYGTAPTPDGRWLLVALIGLNKVAVVDLAARKVSQTLDVPKAPQEILVRPDGARAYVSCDASAQVAEIDLREWKVSRLIPAGPGADGLAWAPRKPR